MYLSTNHDIIMSAWSMYQCCSQLALQSREPDFVLLPHSQLHASLWTAPPSRHLHTANSTGSLLENSRRVLAEVLLSATRLQPHLDGRKMDVGEQVLTSLLLCSRFSQAIFWHLVVGQETPPQSPTVSGAPSAPVGDPGRALLPAPGHSEASPSTCWGNRGAHSLDI